MRRNHGYILIIIGTMHTLFGLTPWAFGKRISQFGESLFFNVNPGLSDFPLLGGTIKSDAFAAFWFIYFGLMLIPVGLLLQKLIAETSQVPKGFAISYLIVVVIGAYMIPFSGMTIIMLPHALLMLRDIHPISPKIA